MKTKFALLMIVAFTALSGSSAALYAQKDQKSEAANVAGRWAMSVEGGPHGATTMGLVLQQDGKKISGTFASPHGDMPVEGEFADGALSFATTSSGGEGTAITFKAKLKDDGTMAGYISSQMGDMTWTAQRVRDSK